MQVDYIRRDVPAEISEEGGAYIQIVGKNTVGLADSIREAIKHLYCIGEPSLIEGYFVGLMRSVFEGIKDDGHPRSVGDIQFYPVCGGTFDLDKGWDPAVNDVRIKARLVNGVELDVTDWTFRDMTQGRVAFKIEKIGDGTEDGVVTTGKDIEINGSEFPAKELLSVSWRCGLKGNTVAEDKFTRTVSRLTIDKSILSTLAATDDGLPFEVTVKGCYNKAVKTGVVKYVAEPLLSIPDVGLKVMTATPSGETLTIGENFTLAGEGLKAWVEGANGIESIDAYIDDEPNSVEKTYAADGKSATLKVLDSATITSGSHTVRFAFSCKTAGGVSKSGEMSLAFVK